MYSSQIEEQMQRFYSSLSEKDRRRYAAIESIKLGHGGQQYLCDLLGCDRKTLVRGLEELHDEEALQSPRIRQAGGGRPHVITHQGPTLEEAFLHIMADHTAGSPMDESIKWTNLSKAAIKQHLHTLGFAVSRSVVQQLLSQHGFRKRKALKTLAGGQSKNRNAQFETIERLIKEYQQAGNPVISMDTKKKN
jgi:hypothetical protein